MTSIWRKKTHKNHKENDIFWWWKYKIEDYFHLRGKWDQKQSISILKISKEMILFQKCRQNIEEKDSNAQVEWDFLLKKTKKFNSFLRWWGKGFARTIGNEKFWRWLSTQISNQIMVIPLWFPEYSNFDFRNDSIFSKKNWT